jgi:predicted RecA/RadA family phage recombinase
MSTIINGTSSAITFPDATVQNSAGLAAGGTIATGTITALSTSGITFPATQVPSADANTLDDYEEGTWTPNVGGTSTYSVQIGTYVKIGKMVTVNFDMAISTIGTGSTTTVFGFPFTSSNDGFPRTGAVSYYANLSISPIFIAFYVANNGTSCVFVWNTAGSATVGFNASNLFASTSRIIGSVTYSASA